MKASSAPSSTTIEAANATSTTGQVFDWTLMRSFLAVLDAGSLLGAARRLRQSQPTLGRHISVLEAELGTALFERTGRGLMPTNAARDIAIHARQMQDAADALQRSLSRQHQSLAGTVRLTASQTVAAFVLPALLLKLRQALPEIQIELVASNDVKNLLRREADIALRMVRPVQESLVTRKIATLSLGTYAHSRYLKQHGTPRTTQDLLRHQLIGYDQDPTIIDGFRVFGEAITREHFALRSDDHIVQWQALRAGLGIGFAADYLAQRERTLTRILPELALPSLPVWLTTHREIHGNPRIRRVFDFLAENWSTD
jgi:DNA-binding transcriptional LysR family regulator